MHNLAPDTGRNLVVPGKRDWQEQNRLFEMLEYAIILLFSHSGLFQSSWYLSTGFLYLLRKGPYLL